MTGRRVGSEARGDRSPLASAELCCTQASASAVRNGVGWFRASLPEFRRAVERGPFGLAGRRGSSSRNCGRLEQKTQR